MLGEGETEKTEREMWAGEAGETEHSESSEVRAGVGGVCGKAVKILTRLEYLKKRKAATVDLCPLKTHRSKL